MSATLTPGAIPSRSITRSASPWRSRVASSEYSAEMIAATGRSGFGNGDWPPAVAEARRIRRQETVARSFTRRRRPGASVEGFDEGGRDIGALFGERGVEQGVGIHVAEGGRDRFRHPGMAGPQF